MSDTIKISLSDKSDIKLIGGKKITLFKTSVDKAPEVADPILEMRNNTSVDARNLLHVIAKNEGQNDRVARALREDVEKLFAGDMDENINLLNKDNVVRILKIYNFRQEGTTLTQDICDEWITNKTKKSYINHIKNSFEERAKELGINTDDLNAEFESAMKETFSGWKAICFGYIKNSDIQKIDDVFNKYIQQIEAKEIANREAIFHKPVKDEEIGKFLDENDDWGVAWRSYDGVYDKELANDTTLSKGIHFTGKIDYPAKQRGGSCVIHASVNSLVQNEKGAHLVNRMFRLKEDENGETLVVCIPEALKNNIKYSDSHRSVSAKTLASVYSFGDGDMAALLGSYSSYIKNAKRDFAQVHLGFEALSGEKAQVFLPDESIPMGVGVTNAQIGSFYHNGYHSHSDKLYDEMKTLMDEGKLAVVYSMETAGYFNNDFGKYIKDIETGEEADEDVMVSSGHAYSVVKLTDDWAYLQESNNPDLYIKMDRSRFVKRMNEISTWRYD